MTDLVSTIDNLPQNLGFTVACLHERVSLVSFTV